MVFSKREQFVAIGVVSVLGLWIADSFAIEPYFQRREQIVSETAAVNTDLNKVDQLFRRQRQLRKVWDAMNAGGLRSDPSEAESQVEHALEDWSQDSGVNLSSLKYERSSAEGKFLQISFHATGTGPMATVANLLWRVETTSMPLRVNEIQITPRKEGTDDLQIQLSISTLCRLPDNAKPEKNRPVAVTADARGVRS